MKSRKDVIGIGLADTQPQCKVNLTSLALSNATVDDWCITLHKVVPMYPMLKEIRKGELKHREQWFSQSETVGLS